MSAVESHYQPQTSVPEVKFALNNIPPPSSLYVGREDKLFITSLNSASGFGVEIHARLLLPSGIVVPNVFTHTPNSDRTSKTDTFTLAEGFLLSLFVVRAAGAAKRGQCYVIVGLTRGDVGVGINHQAMIQGYVASSVNQGWPGNTLQQPSDGPGFVHVITGTQPAAGAQIAETVPTGARWRLMVFHAQLVTAVTAGVRTIRLKIDDGVTGFIESTQADTQNPSLTQDYFWGQGMPIVTSLETAFGNAGLPVGLILPAGMNIRTSVVNMAAGDQWAADQMLVEEWIEP